MSGWVTSVDDDVAENSHHSGNILTTLTQAAAIKQLQRVEGMAMTCSLGESLKLRFVCYFAFSCRMRKADRKLINMYPH